MPVLVACTIIALTFVLLSAKIMLDFSTFDKAAESEAFIDKTLFIEDLFNQPWPHFVVKTPKQFGKSTNMDMVRRFYEVQVYRNGSIIPPNSTENFKIFSKMYDKVGRHDFLKIFKRKEFVIKHFGQYPVIYLDFNGLVGEEGFHFMERFIDLVKSLFTYHMYLLHSEELSEDDKSKFTLSYNFTPDKAFLINNPTWVQEGLRTLAKLLVKHFRRKVILLIDNYDSPTQDIMFEKTSRWHWSPEKIGEYLEEVVQTLLDCWDSESVLIQITLINASIPPMYAFGLLDSEIKHLDFKNLHVFSKYYGLQKKDVLRLARRFGVEKELDNIQKWYGGYRMINSSLEMFNIYSILKYTEVRKIDRYWTKVQNLHIVEQALKSQRYHEISRGVKTLCEGGEIQIQNIITGNHIYQIRYIVNDISDFSITTDSYLLFFNLMVDFGFLSVKREENSTLTIQIVNEEVKNELKHLLRNIRGA